MGSDEPDFINPNAAYQAGSSAMSANTRSLPSLLIPSLWIALTASLQAQGADECAHADDIGVTDVLVPFDTTHCTDTGLPATTSPGGCPGSADVWFKWRATRDTQVVFSMCPGATFDTFLAVFEGSDCANLSLVGCNDNSGVCGLNPRVTVAVLDQHDYYIKLGASPAAPGAHGDGTLQVAQTPLALTASDNCQSAPLIGAGTQFVNFDASVCADTLAPATTSFTGGPCEIPDDIWMRWIPTRTCDVDFIVCANTLPQVGIWEGFNCAGSVNVHCQQAPNCTIVIGGPHAFRATRGQVYFIQIGRGQVLNAAPIAGTITINQGLELGLGFAYCNTEANSTGLPATISARGSTSIALNNFELVSTNVPTGQFCYFVASRNFGFTPNPVGMGNLCLGAGKARFNQLVGAANAQGIYERPIPLTTFPTNPHSPVLSGETWRFVTWFRDQFHITIQTSNFSNGVAVTFQ